MRQDGSRLTCSGVIRAKDLLLSKGMRRGVHAVFALLAVFLLVRPFDCFSSGKFDQKAMDCCKKGKCSPSNADNCCKATVAGGNQIVIAQGEHHSQPVVLAITTDMPSGELQLSAISWSLEINHPPGSPPDLRLNLPLLI